MPSRLQTIARLVILALLCSLAWGTTAGAETTRRGIPDREDTLIIGCSPQVFYNVDPRDVAGVIEVWVRSFERTQKNGEKVTIVTYKTLGEAEKALAKNEVDILIMIPEEFVSLRSEFNLIPILSADYGKQFYNELLLLVREDGGITRVDQLRGKNLRIDVGQQGSIPIKWLDSFLTARLSANAQGVFGSISECSKGSQAIMPVFFRQAEACLVSRNHFDAMVELNPQLGRQLRILERSPGFVTGIIAARKDLVKAKRDSIVKALREINADPKGKQIMTLFRINRLVPFLPEHLASIEKVLRDRRGKADSVALRIH